MEEVAATTHAMETDHMGEQTALSYQDVDLEEGAREEMMVPLSQRMDESLEELIHRELAMHLVDDPLAIVLVL